MNTLTITATFDLTDDVTLTGIKDGEEHGTLMLKDGKISYYIFETKKTEDFEDDTIEFATFAMNNHLTFKKCASNRYVLFQPNPKKNNTTDCSFRAYAKVQGITWEEAYDIATALGREMNLMPNDHRVVDKILVEKFGFTFTKYEKGDAKKTVNEFAIEHPKGTYVGWMHGHVVAIVDGNYYDSWDSGSRKMKGYYSKNN